jgi:hypothetical protein
MEMKFFQVLVQPGKYYLGDPCYTVPDYLWMDLLNSADFFSTKNEGTAIGFTVYAFSTAYGDGVYAGSNGFQYGVDSGLIGLVPVELAINTDLGLVTEIEFTSPTMCTYKNGLMCFGNVTIDTELDDPEFEDEDN